MRPGVRLVTVAHGTRDPGGSPVAEEITARAAERLGVVGLAAYVELTAPLVVDVLAAAEEPTVVVPLLLSRGFHIGVDLPAAVAAASAPVALGAALGPDPAIAAAMAARLDAAGLAARQRVVLVAAGSNHQDATEDVDRAAAHLAALTGHEVVTATLSGRGDRISDVVAPGDAVAPYLLAPGYFVARARALAEAAGATVIADAIGPHPRIVDLVVERASQLARILP